MPLDFSDLVLDDASPIYQQIIQFIKMKIAANQITSGDELPSRRLLSATLNVNPNTIQKAYKQIEQEGLLVSYAGSKSLLQFDSSTVTKIRHELIYKEATQFINALKTIGISREEANELLLSLWDEKQKEEI